MLMGMASLSSFSFERGDSRCCWMRHHVLLLVLKEETPGGGDYRCDWVRQRFLAPRFEEETSEPLPRLK